MRDREPNRARVLRCAIYTRKSTEEGLDQEFNSLDAQREACAAYVLSQKHEGWKLLPEMYDDGGFSGGNMDRPGLKALLAEVAEGRVDVIVVYKVDRLTRSLADFAKIVEVLDRARASFVSVTQAFNTTTSMGRLTLNVLLSFAQFEREVTGERIRDKIAASKKKGMWMGGTVPLGYDVTERKLVVNDAEAQTVRHIYQRYIALRSLPALADELAAQGIRSKARSADARRRGATVLSTGALSYMLSSRVYLGEVRHKQQWFAGEHSAIVPIELWEEAARARAEQLNGHRRRTGVDSPSILAGLLYDHLGRPMVPDHATKGTRRYRYYVSRRTGDVSQPRSTRLPAHDIEQLVLRRLRAFLTSAHELATALGQLDADETRLLLERSATLAGRLAAASPGELCELLPRLVRRICLTGSEAQLDLSLEAIDVNVEAGRDAQALATVATPLEMASCSRGTRLVTPQAPGHVRSAQSASLMQLIGKAYAARQATMRDPARSLDELAAEQGVGRTHLIRLLRLSYLSPQIVGAITAGEAHPALTAQRLLRAVHIPDCWREQGRMFDNAAG